mgnify:CR=1 FL=1
MRLFRRLFNIFSPSLRIEGGDIPDEDLSKADKVIDLFHRDYFHEDVVPRGTITAIAREAGCSQGYVSRLAKANGYRVGKSE